MLVVVIPHPRSRRSQDLQRADTVRRKSSRPTDGVASRRSQISPGSVLALQEENRGDVTDSVRLARVRQNLRLVVGLP